MRKKYGRQEGKISSRQRGEDSVRDADNLSGTVKAAGEKLWQGKAEKIGGPAFQREDTVGPWGKAPELGGAEKNGPARRIFCLPEYLPPLFIKAKHPDVRGDALSILLSESQKG